MEIKITQEKRGEVERIQNELRSKLSPNEILRGTAQGVNSALTRSIPRINKRIKERYNISQKYLSRQAVVSPKANSGSLYGGIKINESRLPIIAFKPKQSGSSISVAIHKGKNDHDPACLCRHHGQWAQGGIFARSLSEAGGLRTRARKDGQR